ncbi:RAB3GAP2_N domain-containing protein [Meloidogyne graminicola]|uniref:RAB3GAP2_N domain-containing protein n=1 Tax=Meloidogyne graminicola TaxID=189291 RepID=A0A8S9ZVB2_9BILA|nr:RAB3GAP2_N domain-containing protein [Meloidogyne graminicola]
MSSSLNVIAKIPQITICSISNFLLSDKKLHRNNNCKLDEDNKPDTEKPVDFNGFEAVRAMTQILQISRQNG